MFILSFHLVFVFLTMIRVFIHSYSPWADLCVPYKLSLINTLFRKMIPFWCLSFFLLLLLLLSFVWFLEQNVCVFLSAHAKTWLVNSFDERCIRYIICDCFDQNAGISCLKLSSHRIASLMIITTKHFFFSSFNCIFM